MVALRRVIDLDRPGRNAEITPEAMAWVVSLACRKASQINRDPVIHRWNFRINDPSLAPAN